MYLYKYAWVVRPKRSWISVVKREGAVGSHLCVR